MAKNNSFEEQLAKNWAQGPTPEPQQAPEPAKEPVAQTAAPAKSSSIKTSILDIFTPAKKTEPTTTAPAAPKVTNMVDVLRSASTNQTTAPNASNASNALGALNTMGITSNSMSSVPKSQGILKKGVATETQEEAKPESATKKILKQSVSKALPIQSMAKGVTSAIDSMTDFGESLRKFAADTKAKKNPYDYEAQQKKIQRDREYQEAKARHGVGEILGEKAGQAVSDWEQRVEAAQQALVQDNPDSKLAKALAFVEEGFEGAGRMIPSVLLGQAAGTVAGGLAVAGGVATDATIAATTKAATKAAESVGYLPLWTDVFSMSYDESMQSNKDPIKAGYKAFADATLEVAVEAMSGGLAGTKVAEGGILSNTAVGKLVESSGVAKLAQRLGVARAGTTLGQLSARVDAYCNTHLLADLVRTGWGEAKEEMLSEFLSPFIERATTDPTADNATVTEMLQAGLSGALVSFIMAPFGLAGRARNTNTITAEEIAQKEKSLAAEKAARESAQTEKSPVAEKVAKETAQTEKSPVAEKTAKAPSVLFEHTDNPNYSTEWKSSDLRELCRIANDLIMAGIYGLDAEVAEQYGIRLASMGDPIQMRALIGNPDLVEQVGLIEYHEGLVTEEQVRAKFDQIRAAFEEASRRMELAAKVQQATATREASQAETEEALNKYRAAVAKDIRKGVAEGKYSKEVLDEVQDWMETETEKYGRIVISDQVNNTRYSFNRDQYAEYLFDKKYYQLNSAQKRKVNDEFRAQEAARKQWQSEFAKLANEDIDRTASAKNKNKRATLSVKWMEPSDTSTSLSDMDIGLYDGDTNTILINPYYARTEEAAHYILAHEVTHYIDDVLSDDAHTGMRTKFHAALIAAMYQMGYPVDDMAERIRRSYISSYTNKFRKQGWSDEQIAKWNHDNLGRVVESEVYARMVASLFTNYDILAQVTETSEATVDMIREALEQMRSIQDNGRRLTVSRNSISRHC